MALEDNVTRIEEAKQNLKSAIEAKGVDVPSTMKIDGYADLVSEIKNQSNISSTDKTLNVNVDTEGDVDLGVNKQLFYTKSDTDSKFVSNLTSNDKSVILTKITSGYDLSIGEVNGVTFGYLIDGQFYKENEKSEKNKITPVKGKLFVDLNTNDAYNYTQVEKKEDVIPEKLLNGKFGNISNAIIDGSEKFSDYYYTITGTKVTAENDVIVYGINDETIKVNIPKTLIKGTHILKYSDIVHFMAKNGIESLDDDKEKTINCLKNDFDIQFTKIKLSISEEYSTAAIAFVVDDEYKEILGIDYGLFTITITSSMIYIFIQDIQNYKASTYYVLDSYANGNNKTTRLDVEIENGYTTLNASGAPFQIIQGGDFKCYFSEVMDEILNNIPTNNHIITEDDILNTLVYLNGDVDYDNDIEFNQAVLNTLNYMGIEPFIYSYSGITYSQYAVFYKSKDSEDYKLLTVLSQPSGLEVDFDASFGYGLVYYVDNNYNPQSLNDTNDTNDEIVYENKYVKVSDTKVLYGSIVNEMFVDDKYNKVELIDDKLYYDHENELTYVCVSGALVKIGYSTNDMDNKIKTLENTIAKLEERIKALEDK